MDDRPYYYRLRGRTLGPVGLRQIRQLAQRAQIGRNTDVSRDGVQWAKASDHPEIFDAGDALGAGGSLGQSSSGGDDLSTGSPIGMPTLQSSNWYYSIAGIQKGPVDLVTLRGLVASGQLASTDQVFPDGGTAWVTVNKVPELAVASSPGGTPVINVNVPPQSEGTNGMAIAGFVLSLFPCLSLIGLILSLVALNSPNKANRGLAIAGAVLGGLWTLCGCGYAVLMFVAGMAGVAANP